MIGENIHTTRVLMRKGKRVGLDPNGRESVIYRGTDGVKQFMTIPDEFKKTQVYEEGRVKHFMIAVSKGMSEDPYEQKEGESYIAAEIERQERFGSNFLDLNIDEISYKIENQKKAIKWLVGFYGSISNLPPSIDSSSLEIINVGLEEYERIGRPQGDPMINSASLERVGVLDLVSGHKGHVIVTAAGLDGMPSDEEGRLENAAKMVDQCRDRNISFDRIHIDPLLFPISVDQTFGNHYLEAVRLMRMEFGGDIRITGGLSNVSFGLPSRRLINDTFIRLAIDAGVDSGILNPIESNWSRVMGLNMESDRVKIAMDMLLGRDEFCMNFIGSFREGRLSD
ncbi:MAG: hypothetical protein CL698_09610 [Chloroflexi bacterium]|nr:hypothetical protein [Chloroflexota bacterium]